MTGKFSVRECMDAPTGNVAGNRRELVSRQQTSQCVPPGKLPLKNPLGLTAHGQMAATGIWNGGDLRVQSFGWDLKWQQIHSFLMDFGIQKAFKL